MAPNHNSNCKQLHILLILECKTGNTRNNDNKYTRRLLRADVTAYVTALACLFSEKASAFRRSKKSLNRCFDNENTENGTRQAVIPRMRINDVNISFFCRENALF